MPDPINYAGMQTQSNIGQNFGQGFQLGSAIQEIQQKAEARKAALDRQAKMQIDVHKTFTNPNATPDEIAYIAATYPEISENVTKAWSLRDSASKDASLKAYIPAYSAVLSGKPDVASQLLNERATALKNAGRTEEANQLFQQAELITSDPAQAKNVFGLQLSAIMGPEKFAETYSKLSTEQRAADSAPVELRTKEAEATIKEAQADNAGELEAAKASEQLSKATTAQVEADNADEKAAIDLRKGAADATEAEVTAANAPEVQNLAIKQAKANIGLTNQQRLQSVAAAKKIGAEIEKLTKDVAAGRYDISDPEKRFDFEKKLRDEYTSKTAEFTKTRDAFNRIESIYDGYVKAGKDGKPDMRGKTPAQAKSDSAAGDIGLIFNYMKTLDPGSTVREGEFATVANAGGVDTKLINLYNKVASGERLTPEQRASYYRQSKGLYEKAKKNADAVKEDLDVVVKNYGLTPDNVFNGSNPKSGSKLKKGEDGKLTYGF